MKKLFILAGLLSAHTALAQSPTVVYGESETAPGVWDSYLVEQPENAPNPLGNPIPVEENTDPINVAGPQTESETMHKPDNIAPLNEINQNATQDPKVRRRNKTKLKTRFTRVVTAFMTCSHSR